MIIHPSQKMVRTGSKITCESRQRTVGCCPRIIEVVVLGSTNLLPLGRSSSITKQKTKRCITRKQY
ncbi:MAG: hypothetical protein ACTSO9_14090 [Candidatus Helarchaeota archaeon]